MTTAEVHELFHTVEDGRARDGQEPSQEMLSVPLLCSSPASGIVLPVFPDQ
jgi:hypothetical protein